jgi:hypothetical protein
VILGLCRSSRPQAPTAIQDVLLVNIKVKKFPSHRQLLGPVNIKKKFLLSNFPPKQYPKAADSKPPAGSGDSVRH